MSFSAVILTALQLAIDSRSTNLMTISIDCLGKFITYNYLEDMEDEVAQTQVMEKVVDSICDCFIGEETDEKVQLQIIKALLDAVYSTSNPLHLSALLKAVRTTYNIFLLSRNSANQNIAQVTLTQMVDHVFRRISIPAKNASRSTTSLDDGLYNGSTSKTETATAEEANYENRAEKEEVDDYQQQIIVEANMARSEMDQKLPSGKAHDNSEDFLNDTATMFGDGTMMMSEEGKRVDEPPIQTEPQPSSLRSESDQDETTTGGDVDGENSSEGRQSFDHSDIKATSFETEADLYIKDAILVFRALCKLSKKQISSEWGNDMRSYSMRSKLLSLHLILTILTSHMHVFSSPSVVFSVPVNDSKLENSVNPFILEVKQFLCPSLAKNAFSMVPQVYETTLEILWKVIQGLRIFLKKEIEVFLKEIFLRILEMRNASFQQKHSFLKVVLRICSDPQTLVDIYLNYDCDRQALDNIYERLVNVLSKITTSHMTSHNNGKDHEAHAPTGSDSPIHHSLHDNARMIPPPLTTAMVQSNDKHSHLGANIPESAIKYKSLECLVAVLQSLVNWYTNNSVSVPAVSRNEVETPRESEDQRQSTDMLTSHSNSSAQKLSPASSSLSVNGTANGTVTPRLDDPEQFENKKHRKQLLQEGIRQFNWKPKKGLNILIKNQLLDPTDTVEFARFLLRTDGLSKAMIGEFLGEGEPENIAIMHAFVDELDFSNMLFVDALRYFLQTFRLPGESQKIDRFMLKFAERYVHGNPTVFANAETAYVLAYAVIMLNTDLHNPQVKRHMTLNDFMKNCSGIDDGKDISPDVLKAIFDEIQNNEIKMKEEVEAAEHAALIAPHTNAGALGMIGLQNALVNAGFTRDVRREAYQAATEELGSKTEAMFRNMLTSRRRAGETETITFYVASHVEHVRPMFEVAWMSFLTGISGPLQESDDLDTVQLCLNGFKHAIRIICLFHTVQSEDMDLQRHAFVTTLTNFTFLTNLNEMKPKNVEAIKTLLEIAAADGNYLKGSWKEILSTVSQLERFQLITSGIDQGALPDISAIRHSKAPSKPSVEMGRRSTVSRPTRTATQLTLTEEVASAGSSQSLVLAADKLFTATVNLNGDAIVDFVRALCDTSWEEIMTSAHLEHPRMYSLQKLVEISYYNMNRIRMEWSNIWAVVGEHYNRVGCQSNFNVAFFALDSLRQLAMKFLEKEELPHFKFQKDFLMPFRDILSNNPAIAIKDMVLRCLSQMILARAHHIRSGWKTMLAVFASGAQETTESIVHMTFDIVRSINNERFGDIVANGTFPDYVSCLVEFSKNKKFQKISLPALDMIHDTIPKMLEVVDKDKTIEINDAHATSAAGQTIQSGDDFLVKFWFAVLFGLKEVTMQSDDVEVRRRALQYLFDTLKQYGSSYAPEFWETVSRQIVFPLFDDLKVNSRHQRSMSPEDLSVWLSTTMIEALRNVVDLYTFYFENMREMMRHVLGLFGVCITQAVEDNDTLARIGCECLELYIETNVEKFDNRCWDLVTETFVNLFENTTAHGLFDDTKDLVEKMKSMAGESNGVDLLNSEATNGFQVEINESRQRSFQQVIVKCVLQLMLIQSVNELLSKDSVYCAFPASHLMVLMECLGRSFHFAKRFNMDNDLRMALWRFGFMKQLPNLLKQETSSGGCYVSVLMRMYANLENINDRDDKREEIENTLIPLCNEIFTLYTELDHETKPKNIAAWTPVVVSILNGLAQLQDEDFLRYVPRFYVPAVELLGQDNLLPEIRVSLRSLLLRIGKTYKIGLK
ncbi:guanine nucleotide exchange protein for ADP-robosylation factor [Apophysomyces ossiformis]|uniref:Guanine nucleotide exchange protein for ADP-robosylation factor n=1 Tax=Apophysomyces ossiformis TaxID=679940 RepID=A0A8H7BMZ5_9FUNG|nr:guanine nucleotide exchange protein for ADP-robosylation factor [Apophysomyces ossiformis]